MKNQLPWALCLLVLFILACKAENPKVEVTETSTATVATTVVAPAEFADPKYSEIVRAGLDALSKGDIAAWMDTYADNAVYVWNNGDSLAGKAAISEYWTNRRTNDIESLTFENEILLPVKVNTSQSVEAPGIWVLAWYQTTAKYKLSGKSMTQWIHSDSHFDANGKIDRSISYLDREMINAAMKK